MSVSALRPCPCTKHVPNYGPRATASHHLNEVLAEDSWRGYGRGASPGTPGDPYPKRQATSLKRFMVVQVPFARLLDGVVSGSHEWIWTVDPTLDGPPRGTPDPVWTSGSIRDTPDFQQCE